jgi:hypothetical protein
MSRLAVIITFSLKNLSGRLNAQLLLFPEISTFFYLCGGTLGTAATTGLLYQPQVIGDGDCGKIGGMKIGRGKRQEVQ